MRLRAVLFDMDGTLLDTAPLAHRQANARQAENRQQPHCPERVLSW